MFLKGGGGEEGRAGGEKWGWKQRAREWKESLPRTARPCGCSPVNSDLSYLCEHRNPNLPSHAAAPRARLGVPSREQSLSRTERHVCTFEFQSPTKCIYLTNVTQNSLVADEVYLMAVKTGETFPTFLVSVDVSIKKKKNRASYSSLHTQTEPWYIFGK